MQAVFISFVTAHQMYQPVGLKYIVLLLLLLSKVAQAQTTSKPALDSLTQRIENNTYSGIHSVLINHKGKLVYEHYFQSFTRDSLHDSRSSFKSITSILIGIAIDHGFINDVNQKVSSFFPNYPGVKKWSDQKKQMTLKNLLEMKSGFDCEEFNGTKDCESAMTESDDWVRFSLDLPLSHPPGTYWAYTSCAPMILSGVLSNATKMSVMAFADRYLFKPLGISRYRWTKDPAQHGMTAGSFFIRPADMLKIGQMIADGGVWQGKQIVSKKWIAESTKAGIQIPDFSFAGLSRTPLAQPQPTYYGYYWYREKLVTNSFAYTILFASGNGGQYIMLIDELDLVVVFAGGNYNSWKSKQPFNALVNYIIPCFKP